MTLELKWDGSQDAVSRHLWHRHEMPHLGKGIFSSNAGEASEVFITRDDRSVVRQCQGGKVGIGRQVAVGT